MAYLGGLKAFRSCVGATALAWVLSACAQFDVNEIKMPRVDANILALTTPSVYDNKRNARPLGPADFVDAAGYCGGAAPAAVDASLEPALGAQPQSQRGVALGMSECEVARALGPTQGVEISTNERGERAVVMTYAVGERAGIYRFAAGRLVTIERGPEPPPPPKPERKPSRKPTQARPSGA